MSRQQDRRGLAPFLALFIVCFAAQGVSSASVGSWNKNEDVYFQESALTEIVSLSTQLYAIRGGPAAIFTCVSHYFNDIKEVASAGAGVVVDTSKLIVEVSQNFTQCGDLSCQISVAVTAFNKGVVIARKFAVYANDFRTVFITIFKCTREGGPTPPPPPPPPSTESPPPETDAPTPETEAPPAETDAPPAETDAPPAEPNAPPAETDSPPSKNYPPPVYADVPLPSLNIKAYHKPNFGT